MVSIESFFSIFWDGFAFPLLPLFSSPPSPSSSIFASTACELLTQPHQRVVHRFRPAGARASLVRSAAAGFRRLRAAQAQRNVNNR